MKSKISRFCSSKTGFLIILLLFIISNFLWIYSTRNRFVLFYHKVTSPYQTQGLTTVEKGISKCFLIFNSFKRKDTKTGIVPWNDSLINERITKYRKAETRLIITNAAGKPLPQLSVTIYQVRHKFLFGCKINPIDFFKQGAPNYLFKDIFNYATLHFYWGQYEGIKGHTDYKRIRTIADWCNKRRINTKGHPLVWQLFVPWWVWFKETDEVETSLLFRIQREVKEFASVIDKWDVVNEPSSAPAVSFYGYSPISKLYNDAGRLNFLKKAFLTAHEANPQSTLILNDFVVGNSYRDLISDCLKSEIPIDVIGLQSHMHKKNWALSDLWDICERFKHLNKPLHFTEMTVLSGKLMTETDMDWYSTRKDWPTSTEGEKQQAEAVKKYYRLLFSHPAVEAITWWDFSDTNSWMGAPAGLLRKDMSPKPVYNVLKKLIKNDWWTGPLKLRTDDKGQITFKGFLGDYVVKSREGQTRFSINQAGKNEDAIYLTLPQ
jgi:GH35 family endo-1,4-beta-xylanase